ncbi:hypothetical protein ATE69_13495 [Sphingopyxis sp. H071]|nr:hypothetical protein ATE61_14200 [Sphingopyxis sp. H057]KTE50364.1 hypothetical protein ATE64_16120 [Sphingopyxis sp. H073]KTE52452.1 hypothetical protein ATE69_13495 [Sphingopyxis sp. H071]KTE62946.1 hypothetical protein ATE66_01020 [Sphingopyxis sp. H107]KTE64836.1 hypothetical protein ATE65_10265 [Sphingopyxis sp. H100]KTE72178.1 hypothetical protein ATE60_10250 [Sphingopyxis sp. H081]KTE79709.1 hypothetical protein ATE63_13670 [Sphingopyxis sp. H067]
MGLFARKRKTVSILEKIRFTINGNFKYSGDYHSAFLPIMAIGFIYGCTWFKSATQHLQITNSGRIYLAFLETRGERKKFPVVTTRDVAPLLLLFFDIREKITDIYTKDARQKLKCV